MGKMVQCYMRRGSICQTAWLDKHPRLKVGSIVELKTEEDGKKDGWKVLYIGKELDSEYVQEHSQDYKRTRKASDI